MTLAMIAVLVGIVLGCWGAHKLYQKGLKGGWLAMTLIGFTMWFMSLAFVFNTWGIK